MSALKQIKNLRVVPTGSRHAFIHRDGIAVVSMEPVTSRQNPEEFQTLVKFLVLAPKFFASRKRLIAERKRAKNLIDSVSLFLTGPARMNDMAELEGLIADVEAFRAREGAK